MKKIKCKDTGEVVCNYKAYLYTEHWRRKRRHIAKQRNYTCERCKERIEKGFQIHHKTYAHIGDERDKELMFLCERCHEKIEKRKRFFNTIQGWFKNGKKSNKCGVLSSKRKTHRETKTKSS